MSGSDFTTIDVHARNTAAEKAAAAALVRRLLDPAAAAEVLAALGVGDE